METGEELTSHLTPYLFTISKLILPGGSIHHLILFCKLMVETILIRKPDWTLKHLPTPLRFAVHAVAPFIICPPDVYDNLRSDKPDPWYRAAMIHEQDHLQRQNRFGLMKWYLAYILSPRFRLHEELRAHKAQIRFLAENGLPALPLSSSAGGLSSWIYGKMISFEDAKGKLSVLEDQVAEEIGIS